MANFPVYHGITLAANAYVENLHVEILATDPAPISAGRVWFNSTDKVFKQSTLDGTGAVVVRTFATKEELDAAISSVVTALAANVTTLNGTISTNDATLRTDVNTYITANVSTLNGRVDTEVGNLVTALSANITAVRGELASDVGNVNTTIGTLSSLETSDKTSIVNAINSVKSQVGSLGNAFNYVGVLTGGADAGAAYDLATLAAGGKDTGDYYKVTTAGYFKVGAGTAFYANLNDGLVWNSAGGVDKIDNTDSSVSSGNTDFISVTGSADTGFVVDVGTVFAGRVTTLEGDLASEITRASTAEGNIVTALAANVSTLNGTISTNDSTLRSDVNTYITANVSTLNGTISTNDATLRTDVNTYITANVSTINGTIGSLASLSTTTKGNIVAAINELSSLAAGGTAGVRTDYNATIWTYQSNAAATSHTLTHNLGNNFVDFGVMIQRANGTWYNDIASIEVVSNNSAILYLSTALNVRVIARSAATI